MKEIWKDIPNYKGLYQVSNLGNVKSLERKVKCKGNKFRIIKEKTLKQIFNTSGYLSVNLSNKSKHKMFQVHQLVAIAFLNHKPNGRKIVVDHIDNLKTNNCVCNLQIITARENTSKDRKGVSEYTGVSWNNRNKKWQSVIKINGKQIHLGCYKTELEAYNKYKSKLNQIK